MSLQFKFSFSIKVSLGDEALARQSGGAMKHETMTKCGRFHFLNFE